MMDNKFDDVIIFRLFKNEVKEIDKLIRKNPVAWDNRSHFVRSACVFFLKQIRDGKFKVRKWE